MIIGRELMVQLGLLSNFKSQVLQWYGVTMTMKEPIGLLDKSDLTSCEMSEVVIQTAEPVSIREATERLVKTLEINCAEADLKQVTNNVTHMNSEEINQLLIILKDFKDLFDGKLGD